MAAPRISARAVETAASPALPSTSFEAAGRMYLVAASERHRPVAMPRWATLCWRMTSMTVDRVTIHRRA
jgi:hypothetical protein